MHPKDVVGREGNQWIPFPRKPFARTPPSPSRFTFMAVFFVMGFIFFKFVNFCIPFFRAYTFGEYFNFLFSEFQIFKFHVHYKFTKILFLAEGFKKFKFHGFFLYI